MVNPFKLLEAMSIFMLHMCFVYLA